LKPEASLDRGLEVPLTKSAAGRPDPDRDDAPPGFIGLRAVVADIYKLA
jgi:hypothetical protein